jgi:hypothetical protein
MARRKINPEDKKSRMSIVVSPENFNKIKYLNINGSKFIDWLLEEYFNKTVSGGNK